MTKLKAKEPEIYHNPKKVEQPETTPPKLKSATTPQKKCGSSLVALPLVLKN
jgi:hypothetical protein